MQVKKKAQQTCWAKEISSQNQAALITFPCLRQLAHTLIRIVRPFIFARTDCKLGNHLLLVRLCA